MNAKEIIMKRSTIAKTFTIAAVAVIALGLAPTANAADKGCTNATLKGTFLHVGTGFITAPPALAGPFAGLGTETFDGNGGVTGNATGSFNGNPDSGTFTGTYTVNSDCTGTMTSKFSNGFTAHAYFVLVWTPTATGTSLSEFHFISTDPGIVETGIARRQFPVGDLRN